ncbi:MAG: hypothetical protein WC372_00315 [Candidatus Neomarinimicrobiota bacterium]|nr:hypothetical protein [bacterium]
MKIKRFIMLMLLLPALEYAAVSAADTVTIYAEQLNHYYMFGGSNRLRAEFGKMLLLGNFRNSSSIYSETKRLKTQTDIGLDALYVLSPQWRAGMTGKYFLFRDGQTYHAYDYDQNRLGLKGEYRKNAYRIMLESGYARETRLGIRDPGWYGGVELSRSMAGLFFYPELDWDYSRMGQRENYTFDNRVHFRMRNTSEFRNDLSAGFSAYNREYYISRESDTEERINLAAYLENDLYYRISRHLALDYRMHFSGSSDGLSFNYDQAKETRTRELLGFENDIRLKGNYGAFRGYLGFSNDYKQSRTRAANPAISLPADYIFDKKNILARISWQFSEKDSLSINYLGSLLYYDTPDTNNYDDRDELSYSLSPAWHRRLDDFTTLTLSGNMFLHHYVYLLHQRSAQNHWNRVFALKSEINTLIPERIHWNARQEIYANYFVYDHEDSAFVHVQSMVFRGISLQQNLRWYTGAHAFINAYLFFRAEDNGLLDWKDFIQERTDSKYTLKIELMPGYRVRRSSISLGPVFSYRQDFRYLDITNRMESYHSRRIGGRIALQLGNYLVLNYRLESIRQSSTADRYNQSGNLRFNWIF